MKQLIQLGRLLFLFLGMLHYGIGYVNMLRFCKEIRRANVAR